MIWINFLSCTYGQGAHPACKLPMRDRKDLQLKESIMEKPRINIDKQIDEGKCPGLFWCTVATTCYPEWEREHKCYRCWKEYCKENEIEIDYGFE